MNVSALIPADVRAIVVTSLARALVTAWHREQLTDDASPAGLAADAGSFQTRAEARIHAEHTTAG